MKTKSMKMVNKRQHTKSRSTNARFLFTCVCVCRWKRDFFLSKLFLHSAVTTTTTTTPPPLAVNQIQTKKCKQKTLEWVMIFREREREKENQVTLINICISNRNNQDGRAHTHLNLKKKKKLKNLKSLLFRTIQWPEVHTPDVQQPNGINRLIYSVNVQSMQLKPWVSVRVWQDLHTV